MRELDRLENDSIPDLAVDSNLVEFGKVTYLKPEVRSFTVENQGQVNRSFASTLRAGLKLIDPYLRL